MTKMVSTIENLVESFYEDCCIDAVPIIISQDGWKADNNPADDNAECFQLLDEHAGDLFGIYQHKFRSYLARHSIIIKHNVWYATYYTV